MPAAFVSCPWRVSLAALMGTILVLAHTAAALATPLYPFPQHVTYASGTTKPNHRTQTQQDNDVRAFYDRWKADFVLAAGTDGSGHPLYRIAFGLTSPNRERTVSEGQGFGMIILALMAGHDANAQVIFDGLWRFTRANPSSIDARLMRWIVPTGSDGDASAFDGDCDMAYGLLLADKQWGSAGTINYLAEATQLLAGMLASTIGPNSRLPMLGDWVNPAGSKYNQYTPRSSDFMPDHFRAFGRATGNPVWSQVVTAVQNSTDYLQLKYSPTTGLFPDFMKPTSTTNKNPRPVGSNFLESAFDGSYYYNAARDPWRLGTDAVLNNDAKSLAEVRKISSWIQTATAGNPGSIRAGYKLSGSPLSGSNYFTTVFVAPFGVAAMTQPSQQSWLNAIYSAVYNVHEDYFEDSVTLLCLLVLTGNYWDPTTIGGL